jgi:hypothetical protein
MDNIKKQGTYDDSSTGSVVANWSLQVNYFDIKVFIFYYTSKSTLLETSKLDHCNTSVQDFGIYLTVLGASPGWCLDNLQRHSVVV